MLLAYSKNCLLGVSSTTGCLPDDILPDLKGGIVKLLCGQNSSAGPSPLLILLRCNAVQVLDVMQASFADNSPSSPWQVWPPSSWCFGEPLHVLGIIFTDLNGIYICCCTVVVASMFDRCWILAARVQNR